jgi:hypothetical protein
MEEVTTALSTLVGAPGSEAISLLQSEENTPFAELKGAFPTVPTAVLRSSVTKHLRKSATVTEDDSAKEQIGTVDLLPVVPEDSAWLEMLKTGGVLKVGEAQVISAVRAGLASRTGLYDLPQTLVERMEQQAKMIGEPVGPEYYKLHRLLTERSYAEIFAALQVNGRSHASQRRKNEFLSRLDSLLWSTLSSFHQQLKSWTESWAQGMSNPAMLMTVLAAGSRGMGALPPGVMQPPATDGLRDGAEEVIEQINKVFAGTGIPVSAALAWDAQQIKSVLEDPALPAQVGAVNRDQMLKSLGVAVSADYVRLERNVTRYMLSIMMLPKLTAGQSELAFLSALYMLGAQIPWEKVATPPRRTTPLRGANPRNETELDDE